MSLQSSMPSQAPQDFLEPHPNRIGRADARTTANSADYRLPEAIESLCVNDLILEAVEGLAPVSEHFGIKIQTVLDPDLPCCRLDAVCIGYALRSVIDNAIRFSKSNGAVDIWTALSARRGIVITVADRGVGICREDLDRIFQPSQPRIPATAGHYNGAGIGIALAKTYVECHGGSIWLTSKPDVGTTVEIMLPLGDAPKRSE